MPEQKMVKQKSSSALILGILSIVFSFLIPLVGLVLGIIGLMKSKNTEEQESASGARVCSIIGLILSVLFILMGLGYILFALILAGGAVSYSY